MARRVILEMDVHCTNCTTKIRRAVQNLLGVELVQVTLETGLVVITGTADAEVLRKRIQHKLRRKVKIISGGAAPQPRYEPQYGGWVVPPAPPRPYGAPQLAYPPYAGNRWAAPRRRHVSHGVPARREDDEEGPENCCSIQ